MSKQISHLDLHPIAKDSRRINEALTDLITHANEANLKQAEVITGKGSGQLMKRVKKFLDQKAIKAQYKRVVVDSNNHGRLFIHFR